MIGFQQFTFAQSSFPPPFKRFSQNAITIFIVGGRVHNCYWASFGGGEIVQWNISSSFCRRSGSPYEAKAIYGNRMSAMLAKCGAQNSTAHSELPFFRAVFCHHPFISSSCRKIDNRVLKYSIACRWWNVRDRNAQGRVTCANNFRFYIGGSGALCLNF